MASPTSPRLSRVLIAASGTGGHLIPALLIARGFLALDPPVHVEFVGSGRPLEATILGDAGIRRHTLRAVGLKKRGFRGALEFFLTLPGVIRQSWRLLREFRPDAVVGVGGYASFFPVALAKLFGCATWIHEVELRPGVTNFLLALFVDRVSLAFPDAKIPLPGKGVVTGHPVKEEILGVANEPHEVEFPQKILVMGGSQGAQSIDTAMTANGAFLAERGIEILHQCRPENVEVVRTEYARHGVTAEVVPFIRDVAAAYRWCDLVVARSGAGTVIEVDLVNRPAIFVPLPTAAGNEQEANAALLAERGRAVVVREGVTFTEELREALGHVLDPARYAAMRKNTESAHRHAVSRIVGGVVALVRKEVR